MVDVNKIFKILFMIPLVLVLNACVVPHGPHGHSHSHTVVVDPWFYYPNHWVYYHSVDHYYYYLDGTVWRKSLRLPPSIVLNHKHRVRIKKIKGQPYLRHSNHRRLYPGERRSHRPHRPRRNGNRDDHRDGRHDNDRRSERPADRKEGKNIFIPHTKEVADDKSPAKKSEKRYKKDKRWKKQAKKVKNSEDGKYQSENYDERSKKENGTSKGNGNSKNFFRKNDKYRDRF